MIRSFLNIFKWKYDICYDESIEIKIKKKRPFSDKYIATLNSSLNCEITHHSNLLGTEAGTIIKEEGVVVLKSNNLDISYREDSYELKFSGKSDLEGTISTKSLNNKKPILSFERDQVTFLVDISDEDKFYWLCYLWHRTWWVE